MENEIYNAQLKNEFSSYMRRYRSSLKTSITSPETITRSIFQCFPICEVERIIKDLEIIRGRGEEAEGYLKMIISGCQARLGDTQIRKNGFYIDIATVERPIMRRSLSR